ncbi:uncharacterized protein LOC142587540 isoform X1 [Dermacentor variabilis]|uniref:uncharacterized protein LOC142587540 isoform X1 n=1 Tax=Dermacentor variabilis TaxID=34621 RepID=UPI003F5CA60D
MLEAEGIGDADLEGPSSASKKCHRRYCCVVDCHEQEGRNPNIRFYRFPSRPHEAKRRARWISAVRRVGPDGKPWEPASNTRICSRHFVGNEKSNSASHPAYVPTVFPAAYNRPLPPDSSSRIERYQRWQKRRLKPSSCATGSNVPHMQTASEETFDARSENPSTHTEQQKPAECSDYTGALADKTRADIHGGFLPALTRDDEGCPRPLKEDLTSAGTLRLETSAQSDDQQMVTRAVGPHTRSCYFAGYESIVSAPDALRSLCGVDSNAFSLLLSLLPAVSERTDVTIENKLLMFLMKMKLGVSFAAIGVMFGVHESTACCIFYTILNTLAEVTKDWIYKPPIEDIKLSQPECFKENYPECTLIIDCTEVKTETPSEVRQQHMLFSSYKSCCTLKFLVGIIPNGMIVFASEPFGGRCSDTQITLDSGFLHIVEPGDMILADKGFPGIRTELAHKGVVMIMPPLSAGSGVPFSREEMERTCSIASVRVHVERVIKRIKQYGILKHDIPISLISSMKEVFHMCCVLANLQPHITAVA